MKRFTAILTIVLTSAIAFAANGIGGSYGRGVMTCRSGESVSELIGNRVPSQLMEI